MSLSEAIQALRKAVPVPWVPSAENRREPPEALPAVAVPWVPPVPSEKSGIQPRNENAQPLTVEALAALVAKAARHHGLDPADLWAFLSLDDIAALQAGAPDLPGALWAFAESRSLTGDRTGGGHDAPFPGTGTVEPTGGLQPVRCGDCAAFQPDTIGDGTGIGRCGRGIEPGGGPLFPRVERYCRGFQGNPWMPE
ncbi:hypothetical protein SAMN02949497_4394 [Methylomagnum ishizawai]|uniref:Uncharacterized protein n=1 Tax=Methylomagnum ishizawai TaxID=1760988 RepID=A0A1Y6D3I4_9GAMM|nr:hypothetical protein [Methylomagnum ishizawai]SMF96564.1 hypothetical protein SAMN02949497_3966 [Methylomagnum ishizawai]SMF96980.1 hypothetical protein SAMN02949497_4394 [Methylomagnum ishizawai]